jgi:hypothetical protein
MRPGKKTSGAKLLIQRSKRPAFHHQRAESLVFLFGTVAPENVRRRAQRLHFIDPGYQCFIACVQFA